MRRTRLRRHVTLLLAMTIAFAHVVVPAPAAHAVLTTQDKLLYTANDQPLPRFVYDQWGNSTRMPGCTVYPGISMDGEVLARAYITTQSYVKLYFTFKTHYDEYVAIAKNARRDFSCFRLTQFASYNDKYGHDRATIQALYDSGCAVPNAAFWNSWCRLAQWELDPAIGGVNDPQHHVYKTLNLDLNTLCREPKYVRNPDTDQPYVPPRKTSDGLPRYRGPASYVAWKDPGVTLATQNLEGAALSGVQSATSSVLTFGGFLIELTKLLLGFTGWEQFIQTIATSAAGLNAYGAIISTVIQLLVMGIFQAFIDTDDAEVKVGDFTLFGGTSRIDPGAQRPNGSGKYGTAVGYGKVQNLAASNDYADWLSQQALQIYTANPRTYPNPTSSPAAAITMQREVAKRIAKATNPLHAAALAKRGTYCVNKDSAGKLLPGKNVPWMSTVMEQWDGAPAKASQMALDFMVRQWVHTMTGDKDNDPKFICVAAQRAALSIATRRATVHAGADDPNDPLNDPWLRAGLQCQVGTIGNLLTSIWIGTGTDDRRDQPNFCMNQYPSITKHDGKWHFYEPDLWATLTEKDFHCGQNEHFREFFSLIQGFV